MISSVVVTPALNHVHPCSNTLQLPCILDEYVELEGDDVSFLQSDNKDVNDDSTEESVDTEDVENAASETESNAPGADADKEVSLLQVASKDSDDDEVSKESKKDRNRKSHTSKCPDDMMERLLAVLDVRKQHPQFGPAVTKHLLKKHSKNR